MNNSFIVLFVSSYVFLIGTALFSIIEFNPYAIVYFFIGVIGIILSFALYVVSTFIQKGQKLKEENDSIL